MNLNKVIQMTPNPNNFRRGFVLVSKSILEDEKIMLDPSTLQIVMYLLLEASYERREVWYGIGKGRTLIKLERGQLVTGSRQISARLKLARATVDRRLRILEEDGFLSRKMSHQYTIVTICNYNEYQDMKNYGGPASEPPKIPPKMPASEPHLKKCAENTKHTNNDLKEVIDHLNEVLKKGGRNGRYRYSGHNADFVSGRLNDGFTVDELKAVIDLKASQWLKPPKSGQKDMRMYVRPDTLFRPGNFEKYVSELPVKGKSGSDGVIDMTDFM